jgi:hypothetical protein
MYKLQMIRIKETLIEKYKLLAVQDGLLEFLVDKVRINPKG